MGGSALGGIGGSSGGGRGGKGSSDCAGSCLGGFEARFGLGNPSKYRRFEAKTAFWQAFKAICDQRQQGAAVAAAISLLAAPSARPRGGQ